MIEEPKHPAPFDLDEVRRRETERFSAIHYERRDLDELTADLGSPDEWLAAAMSHVKVQLSTVLSSRKGTIKVSAAAATLLVAKLEELLHGGQPWPWPKEKR